MSLWHFLLICFPHLFSKLVNILFFSLSLCPVPRAITHHRELTNVWGNLECIFSSSNFVLQLRIMTWWFQNYSLAWIWQLLVVDMPGLEIFFPVVPVTMHVFAWVWDRSFDTGNMDHLEMLPALFVLFSPFGLFHIYTLMK